MSSLAWRHVWFHEGTFLECFRAEPTLLLHIWQHNCLGSKKKKKIGIQDQLSDGVNWKKSLSSRGRHRANSEQVTMYWCSVFNGRCIGAQGGTVYWCVGALCWTELINASGGAGFILSESQNKRLALSAKIINPSLYVKYAINLIN